MSKATVHQLTGMAAYLQSADAKSLHGTAAGVDPSPNQPSDVIEIVDTGTAKGKIAVARRDFKAGELIMIERPLLLTYCWGPKVQGSPFTETFAFAKKVGLHPMHFLAVLFYVRLPAADQAKTIDLYCPPLSGLPFFARISKLMAGWTPADGRPDGISDDTMSRVVRVVGLNGYQTGVRECFESSAVFEYICRLSHSCAPNCYGCTYDGTCRRQLRATVDIRKGDELFLPYISDDLYKSIEVRRKCLQSDYYFLCQCTRCAGPNVSRVFYCPNPACAPAAAAASPAPAATATAPKAATTATAAAATTAFGAATPYSASLSSFMSGVKAASDWGSYSLNDFDAADDSNAASGVCTRCGTRVSAALRSAAADLEHRLLLMITDIEDACGKLPNLVPVTATPAAGSTGTETAATTTGSDAKADTKSDAKSAKDEKAKTGGDSGDDAGSDDGSDGDFEDDESDTLARVLIDMIDHEFRSADRAQAVMYQRLETARAALAAANGSTKAAPSSGDSKAAASALTKRPADVSGFDVYEASDAVSSAPVSVLSASALCTVGRLHPHHWLRIRFETASYHYFKRFHYRLPPALSRKPDPKAISALLRDRQRALQSLHAAIDAYEAVYNRPLRIRSFHYEWLSDLYAGRTPIGEDGRAPQNVAKDEAGAGGSYRFGASGSGVAPIVYPYVVAHSGNGDRGAGLTRVTDDYWSSVYWIDRAVRAQHFLHGPNLPFSEEVTAKRTALHRTCFYANCERAARATPTGTLTVKSGSPHQLAVNSAEESGSFGLCTGCGRARYCSAVCQSHDWHVHQNACKTTGDKANAATTATAAAK